MLRILVLALMLGLWSGSSWAACSPVIGPEVKAVTKLMAPAITL